MRSAFRQGRTHLLLVAAVLGVLLFSFSFVPKSSSLTRPVSYGLTGVITPPKVIASSDISFVDNSTHLYVLGDRTNCGADVIDTTKDAYVTTLPAHPAVAPATNCGGPNGATIAGDLKQVWFGDGDSTVKAYDVSNLAAPKLLANVSTHGQHRADELAYDQKDHIIMVGNDQDTPIYETEISATNFQVLGKITINSTNGVEQPAWNPTNDRFYVAVPASAANPGGEIDVIDPVAMKTVAIYPTIAACLPHGLAFGPRQMMAVGCNNLALTPYQSEIMNATSGAKVAVITQEGGNDEVWYNAGDNRYYFTGATTTDGIKGGGRTTVAVVGVVDANSNTWIENIVLPNSAHGSADPVNNHLYVTITGVGIGVIAPLDSQVSNLNSQITSLNSQISSLNARTPANSITTVVSSVATTVVSTVSLSSVTTINSVTTVTAANTAQLSSSIDSLNSQLSTTTTASYAAIAIAVILGGLALAMSRRK